MKNIKRRIISCLQSCKLYFFYTSLALPVSMALLITMFFFAFSSALAEQLSVKVGTYENRPKIFMDEQNRAAGFWVELLEYISEKEQWELEYVHGTWHEGLTGLQNNTIDILPDVAFTQERAELYAFSQDPVIVSWSRLYVHNDDSTIRSIHDLRGKKIAVLENSVNFEGPDGFRELLGKFDVPCTFVVLADYPSVFQATANLHVDAGITNREFAQENAVKYNLKKTPILFQPITIRFAFPKDSSKSLLLREAIDRHITRLKDNENSLYYKLLDKYFESEIAEKTIVILPSWLKTTLLILTISLIFFFSVIIATRIQVQKKTREIRRINRDLQQLATAIEQSSETIVITDQKGNIEYVNPAFEMLTGYHRDEALGKNTRIMKSGQHDQEFYKEMWTTLLRGDVWKGHLVNRKKDGSLFEEDAAISPVISDTGKITNFVAVKRDKSKEKALEDQLRQAQKMEALGTMAGGIAHDFNNILAIILGNAELALGDIPPGESGEPVRKSIDSILGATNRAKDLVNQILAFSRREEIKKEPLYLCKLVDESMRSLRSTIPTSVEIRVSIPAKCRANITDCRLVLVDPTQIHQILLNICNNAVHAMNEKGVLEISLSDVTFGDKVPANRSTLRPGSYKHLSITDNGPGMSLEVAEQIFDPFFTTKGVGKGTGMGLSVVHGIVEGHGGKIYVESEIGSGTTFHIYFPATEKTQKKNETQKKQLPVGTERILLVDDEEMLTEMGSKILERLGYQVTTFTSTNTALEAFKSNPDEFDLVITDQTMPSMCGDELAAEIFQIRPNIPIILCTGYSAIMSEDKAREIGIKEFLFKPLDKEQLALTIRKVLDQPS